MTVYNLNECAIEDEYDMGYVRKTVATSSDNSIRVHFDYLEEHLIEEINHAEIVVGCVAWLTSAAILDALAQKVGVSIVVQKEDFLRPDLSTRPKWTQFLRRKYEALPSTLDRMLDIWDAHLIHNLNQCGAPHMDAVRCVGNYNADKNPAFPRSHHKFVVFCRCADNVKSPYLTGEGVLIGRDIEPYAVWTGSFNFTENATKSLENAVVLTDKIIVKAYLDEFAHVFSLSEELDWTSEWIAPEYRIGT